MVAIVNEADQFIDHLRGEVMESAAVHHPYLTAISSGELPNLDLALRDFAFHYGAYSAKFTHYLSAVIERLVSHHHQQILLANLAEEQGAVSEVELPTAVMEAVADQTHVSLYRRFQAAVGVDEHYIEQSADNVSRHQIGQLWSERFLSLCQTNECVGVGAIGIGTELIVSEIYKQILAGLRAHTSLTQNEHVFFDLHSECDDKHAAQILRIAQDLARDDESREQLVYGARSAVEMRVAFWDALLERAQNFTSNTVT